VEQPPTQSLKRTALTLLVVTILLNSVLLLSTYSSHARGAFLLSPYSHGGPTAVHQDPTNSTTRAEIMAYIVANPGVYLRELCRDLDLSTGVVQYHVWALVKNGELEDIRSGRHRRFFAASSYTEMEQKVISMLRQETPHKILSLLSEGPPVSHAELAKRLSVTSQAVTWQVARLKELGLIEGASNRQGEGKEYHITSAAGQVVNQYLQLSSLRLGRDSDTSSSGSSRER
jgi:predicted transcriptional regulator